MKLLFALILLSVESICIGAMALASGQKHVAVVGGGWGGWGAAKALCDSGVKVTLIDALPDPSGRTPYTTPTGKPFEAGQKGFWFDYPNIAKLLSDIGVKERDVFTNYLNSSFYSPDGLEATAPVFSSSSLPQLPSPLGQVLATFQLFERLPLSDRASMIGLLYAVLDMYRDEKTFAAYDRMTAHELFIRMRLSKRLVDDFLRPTLLIGLFKAPEELSAAVVMELLYFYALAHQSSFDVRWIKKGSIAGNIFGPLSDQLVEKQGLTVLGGCRVNGLCVNNADGTTTTTASAAAASTDGLLNVKSLRYSRAVPATTEEGGSSAKTTYVEESLDDIDGVVLALGVKGLNAVLAGSPEIAQSSTTLSSAASLGAIDCISCRIWLDKFVPTRTPANVFSRFRQLRGAGGTFFMLDQLQKDNYDDLWGPDAVAASGSSSSSTQQTDDNGEEGVSGAGDDEEKEGENQQKVNSSSSDNIQIQQGSVLAVDFYNAGALTTLGDDFIIDTIMNELLPSCVPGFKGVKVVDSYVQRYPGAVSWFSPGSYYKRPRTSVQEVQNLYCAGDWVVMTDDAGTLNKDKGKKQDKNDAPYASVGFQERPRNAKLEKKLQKLAEPPAFLKGEHGAKGLCQERAYVSGLLAANNLMANLAAADSASIGEDQSPKFTPQLAEIIPVRDDELQVKLGQITNRRIMKLLSKIGLDNPWLR